VFMVRHRLSISFLVKYGFFGFSGQKIRVLTEKNGRNFKNPNASKRTAFDFFSNFSLFFMLFMNQMKSKYC
jgi:hypothetical protein